MEMVKMKDWKEIAKKMFPKEFEEFKKISGRNPDVKFSTIEADVARRDLSINGLFYDLDERKIVDLVGGIEDLKNGIIRFIGDPDMRIKEDPLRISRIIRFTSRYDFKIDTKTEASILKNKSQLDIISKERIWEEIKKSFSQVKDFTIYLNYLNHFNLWVDIFPNSTINTNIQPCNSLEVYLANLFKNENPSTLQTKMVQKYMIPIEISRVSAFLVWFQFFSPDMILEFYNKKNSYKIPDDIILDWIKIAGLKDDIYLKFLKFRPSVSAEELISKGFKGKSLGDEIKRLEIENFKKL